MKVLTLVTMTVLCVFSQQLPPLHNLDLPTGQYIPVSLAPPTKNSAPAPSNPKVVLEEKELEYTEVYTPPAKKDIYEGLEHEPIPVEFWVFLGIFALLILVVVKKSKRDAANRTVIARRDNMNPETMAAQINYHESEIARLQTLLRYYQANQQPMQPAQQRQANRVLQDYPAQYVNSMEFEMTEHPRYY